MWNCFANMCIGIRLPNGIWVTYQGLHTGDFPSASTHLISCYSCSVRCGLSRAPMMPMLKFYLHGFISMSYPEDCILQHSLLPLQLIHSFFLLFMVFPDPCQRISKNDPSVTCSKHFNQHLTLHLTRPWVFALTAAHSRKKVNSEAERSLGHPKAHDFHSYGLLTRFTVPDMKWNSLLWSRLKIQPASCWSFP